MLSRLRTHLAAPIVAQLERDLAHTRRDLEDMRDACLHAESQRDLLLSERADLHARIMDAELLRSEACFRAADLQACLDALTPAPVKPLPEDRRRAILEAVAGLIGMVSPSVGYAPTAESIAEYIDTDAPECLCTVSPSSIMRFVSRLAAEGWLVSDGKKPARYRLTDAGRADLAVAA